MSETDWRERLIEVRQMRAGDVLPHPLNPKIHPPSQNEALTGLLEDVGKCDILKAYHSEREGGQLVFFDGHARQGLKPDEVWNIGIYDVTDDEADKLLLSFDPIAQEAQTSQAKIEMLLHRTSSGNAAVMEFLSRQAEKHGIVPPDGQKQQPDAGGNDFDLTPEDDELDAEEFKGVYALQEDVIFPSSNAWGIPDLLPHMLSSQTPDTVFARQQEPIDPAKTLYVHGSAKFDPSAKDGVLAFYVDDWRFENVWLDAVQMVEGFKAFGWASIVTPDFSVWRDDPMVMQAWNIYRSRWVARYWQEAGLKVIPSLNWADERSYSFAHLGIPKGCPVVSVQCRTTRSRKGKEHFGKGLSHAITELEPQNVLVYGGAEHRQWIEPLLPEGVVYHWLESWTSLRRKLVFTKGANMGNKLQNESIGNGGGGGGGGTGGRGGRGGRATNRDGSRRLQGQPGRAARLRANREAAARRRAQRARR